MKISTLSRSVAAVTAGLLATSVVSAASLTISNTTTVVNTLDHIATATVDVSTGDVAGFSFTLNFVPADLTLPAGTTITTSDANVVCTVPAAPAGTVNCSASHPSNVFTSNITIQFPFDTGATAIPSPGTALTVSANTYANADGDEFALPATNGSVIVTTAPPNIQVSYSPAPGSTVTFPSGVALTTQNASITVNSTGSVGTATVDNCALSGAGASSFSIVTGSVTVPPSDTIDLSCTLPNSGGAATAVLTCRENDSNSTNVNQTWNLSCPQGTPVPGPGYSSVPAPGSLLECDGDAGTTETVSFVVTNNGNAGAGSGLDFSCSAAGAGFSIQSGGTATGLAVGSSQTVTVACTVPAEGAPAATGTVTCTTNAATTPTYNLSSIAQTLPDPVPQPNVVPASSLWSKLALIGLLAGLGIAVVGFRRS